MHLSATLVFTGNSHSRSVATFFLSDLLKAETISESDCENENDINDARRILTISNLESILGCDISTGVSQLLLQLSIFLPRLRLRAEATEITLKISCVAEAVDLIPSIVLSATDCGQACLLGIAIEMSCISHKEGPMS